VTVTLVLFPWLSLLSGPLVLRPASIYHVLRSPVLGGGVVVVVIIIIIRIRIRIRIRIIIIISNTRS
jgi:hypothetical protein